MQSLKDGVGNLMKEMTSTSNLTLVSLKLFEKLGMPLDDLNVSDIAQKVLNLEENNFNFTEATKKIKDRLYKTEAACEEMKKKASSLANGGLLSNFGFNVVIVMIMQEQKNRAPDVYQKLLGNTKILVRNGLANIKKGTVRKILSYVLG